MPPPKSKHFWKIHLFNKYFLGSYQIVNILGNTKVKKIPPDHKEFSLGQKFIIIHTMYNMYFSTENGSLNTVCWSTSAAH